MTKRRRFSLVREAERLFATAKAKNDFSGAASVLRLLRDLQPEESADAARDPLHIDASALTDEEFAELSGLLDALDAFAVKVNGLTTTPVDVPATTTVAPPTPLSEPVVEDEPFVLGENEIEIELDEDEVLP